MNGEGGVRKELAEGRGLARAHGDRARRQQGSEYCSPCECMCVCAHLRVCARVCACVCVLVCLVTTSGRQSPGSPLQRLGSIHRMGRQPRVAGPVLCRQKCQMVGIWGRVGGLPSLAAKGKEASGALENRPGLGAAHVLWWVFISGWGKGCHVFASFRIYFPLDFYQLVKNFGHKALDMLI